MGDRGSLSEMWGKVFKDALFQNANITKDHLGGLYVPGDPHAFLNTLAFTFPGIDSSALHKTPLHFLSFDETTYLPIIGLNNPLLEWMDHVEKIGEFYGDARQLAQLASRETRGNRTMIVGLAITIVALGSLALWRTLC